MSGTTRRYIINHSSFDVICCKGPNLDGPQLDPQMISGFAFLSTPYGGIHDRIERADAK